MLLDIGNGCDLDARGFKIQRGPIGVVMQVTMTALNLRERRSGCK
jgi:hypothetical protein